VAAQGVEADVTWVMFAVEVQMLFLHVIRAVRSPEVRARCRHSRSMAWRA
jgi:hypothetical protein